MHKLVPPFIWQAAQPANYKAIKQIVFKVLEEYGLDQGPVDYCLEDIDLYYFQKGGFFGVVLNENQQIVATAGLFPIGKSSAEIRKMYLLKEYRSKGIGKYMLQQLIEIAHQAGFSRLELETASVLNGAISLYQRFGFKPYRSSHLSERCDQAYELIL